MIISEYEEALDYSIQTNSDDILQSNLLFADSLKKSFDVDEIKEHYKSDINAVIMFNMQNLYYKAVGGGLKT